MVSAAGVQVPQVYTNILTAGGDAQLSQAFTMLLINYPAVDINISQAFINVLRESESPLEVSQLWANVVVRGRVAQPQVRAWTFTLDGHDFYVLRLGDSATLIYDVYSKQWTKWYSANQGRWRFNNGTNWSGSGSYAGGFGSNVVTGDDTLGVLWVLDPEQAWDEDPTLGDQLKLSFIRKATGQVTSNMRNAIPCYEVYLTADVGYTIGTSLDVSLSTSDDNGNTFNNHGAITLTPEDYNQEFAWRSLGQVRAPGRLFVLQDEGALQRINSLDMSVGPEG
jgi:hypothetical protein